jgi:hypothetical protein
MYFFEVYINEDCAKNKIPTKNLMLQFLIVSFYTIECIYKKSYVLCIHIKIINKFINFNLTSKNVEIV